VNAFQWWRSWHGAPIDPKYAVVAKKARVNAGMVAAIMWALLDYASQQPSRGSIKDFDVETYSTFAGFRPEKVADVIQAMNDKGIIANDRLANWEKRQPKREDDSSERSKLYREKKRTVTQSDADSEQVTPRLRVDIDKDKEEEEEKETEAELQPPPSSNIFSLYETEIGIITPFVADELALAEKEYPGAWFEPAIKEAASHNARNWKYVVAILKTWKAKGSPGASPNNNKKGQKERDPTDYISGPLGQFVEH
jgi:DnaD/phage-associated family protein